MRRSIVICLVIAGLATEARADDTINAVLGDASWIAALGEAPDARADEVTRIQVHLTYVLERLRERDGSPARRAALAALERYIARGVFPRRTADPYAGRRPRFIDDRGVHCAVGQLIADSGAPELARSIDARHEYAYVPEIDEPALHAWADAHGFTLDELAMIQPSYGPVPNARDTREGIELEKVRFVLECAAKHPPMRQLVIYVAGDKHGAATATTRSVTPFAQCFVKLASRVETGRGAYRGSPKVYAFDMKLDLPSPQSLFERSVDRVDPSRECLPRPGPIPREATIEAATTPEGLVVKVALTPANDEVTRCFEQHARDQLRAFGPGVWELRHTSQRTVAPRMASPALQQALRGFTHTYATGCAPESEPPAQVTVTAAAKRDDPHLTITVDSKDAAFASCLTDKLRSALHQEFSVYRPLDGKGERYFRIDAPVQATVTVDVETRAAREESLRRAAEENKKLMEELKRHRFD